MPIETLFVMVFPQKPKYLLMVEWSKKPWFSHTIKYESAVKSNKVQLATTVRMNLTNIKFSERIVYDTTYIVHTNTLDSRHQESKEGLQGCW